MFPPAPVSSWIDWKLGSTGVNIARTYWDQREYLRRAYESVHGSDPVGWPSQHPGVVLRGGKPACLRCHYFDPRHLGARAALDLARRHEMTGGDFVGPASSAPEPDR